MPESVGKINRFIAWNGIRLDIPVSWDARVSGQRHLVFEKDFQPQLQVRWEKSAHHTLHRLRKRSTQLAGRMGSIVPEIDFPPELLQIRDNFGLVTCYRGETGIVRGGVCLCVGCHTMILFQLLSTEPALLTEVGTCLATVSCHDHAEILWRIQDFSFITPGSFTLKDYAFGAGLTRLSFYESDLLLQTCKLGPADDRLRLHSLAEILITLTGCHDLKIVNEENDITREGFRSPTITKQIFFRLRREKAFVRARIWHDVVNNLLLAVVFSSNRPISPTTTDAMCRRYEIIQEKN